MACVVVTIDTEEEGRWSPSYPRHGNTCENVGRLPRIHALLDRLRVVPTYLVDYPVATDERARGLLAGFAAGGGCEIGAHLHPWCTPPFEEGAGSGRPARWETFPNNLPPAIQRAKLERLCEAIQQFAGARPTSYRAGRWGFDHTTLAVLEPLGFTVDTSVTPLWWDTEDGGPEFAAAPQRPYRLGRRDVRRVGGSSVVEVPASVLVTGPGAEAIEWVVRRTGPAPGLRRLLVGLGLRALWPEQFDLPGMIRLADRMAGRGLDVFNVSFHSSAALPGATPYVRTESDLDRFCARLEGILEHVVSRHGAQPLALSAVPAHLGDAVLSGPPE